MKKEQNLQSLPQQQECSICLMNCVRPVRCRGPCRNFFCIKCVAESKRRSRNACPNRCSQPFQIIIPQIPLKCPYNEQDCNITISTPLQLRYHFQTCLFISPENRELESLKYSYKCQRGHQLTFLDLDVFEKVYGVSLSVVETNQICAMCQKQSCCRTLCFICSTRQKKVGFCVQCRPFPCTKTFCPLGHRLRRSNKVGKNRYCDFCQVPAEMISSTAYGYCTCGFDVCESCYNKLPSHNKLIPVKIDQKKLNLLTLVQDISSQSEWKQE